MKKSAKDNQNLMNYVRNSIQVERFGEPYATLLVETFVRMQNVLNLTPGELIEDINNFSNSVYQFRFDKLSGNTMGYFSPSKHEIVFDFNYWQDMMNRCSEEEYSVKFFETFSHECLHGMQEAISSNGQTYNRAGGYNQILKNRSHAIYEICTQAVAAKISRNRTIRDYEHGEILAGDGYSDEIFAVGLIASTFGVSEQEVLKYGIRERSKLITALDKNIKNRAYTEQIVNKIENELETIHSITYPDDNQKEFKNMSSTEKSELKTKSILNLVNFCQEVFANRIKNIPLDIDKKTVTAYKADQKKMLDTLRNEFFYYGHNLSRDHSTMYYLATDWSENAVYIKNSLNILSDIAKDTNGVFVSSKEQIITYIKHNDFESLERMGVFFDRNETQILQANDLEMRERKLRKDYNSLIDWDNSDISNIIFRRRTNPIFNNSRIITNQWNLQNLNSYEGYRKLEALKKAARLTARAHGGRDIRYVLGEFIDSDGYSDDIYTKITRTNNARNEFKQEFATNTDKEFLVKMMAKYYLDSIYDFQTGALKANINDEDVISNEIKQNLLPTIQKYGEAHTIVAIAQVLLSKNYESISNGGYIGARNNLSLISPEVFYDVISKPLMDEVLQKREISESFKNAVRYSIYRTEQKYPNTIANRLSNFIEDYRQTGSFRYNHFTSDGRNGLMQNITSKDGMEALIGTICNDFGERAEEEQDVPRDNQDIYRYYQSMAVNMGTDAFREAMIQAILNKNYDLFPSEFAMYVSTINIKTIMNVIAYPTVDKIFKMNNVSIRSISPEKPYNPSVQISDLQDNAGRQGLNNISNVIDRLKDIFNINKINKIGDER